MKKIIPFLLLAFIFGIAAAVSPAELSEQYQQELLEKLLYIRGEGPMPASMEGFPVPHCGTEISYQASMNEDKFTGKYATMYESMQRPNLPNSIVSPNGLFRVHYATTGPATVFQVTLDTLRGGDGIPDYVNKVAEIADSVWAFEVGYLLFPAPPADGTGGSDSLKDIYITSLGASFYGMTERDQFLTSQSASSYISISKDFDLWPYNAPPDGETLNRRLDAARVTIAHEFFHCIHYGMDYTEATEEDGYANVAWWEMSSVWMEEMAFGQINDYYYYLPYFMEFPWIGLQGAPNLNNFHQYGAVLFPLYLTQKFDTSVILDIWTRCRDYGVGPQFPMAADDAITGFTSSAYGLRKAYNEFSVWNYFTGDRAARAPDGYKYLEAENYYEIPDSPMVLTFTQYKGEALFWPAWPDTLLDGTDLTYFKARMPQNLSAQYLDFENIQLVTDTFFHVFFTGDPEIFWGVTFVGFPVGGIGKASVIDVLLPDLHGVINFDVPPAPYRNIIAILSPSTVNVNDYPTKHGYSLSFKFYPDPSFADSFIIFNPYPNPMIVASPADSINFRATINTKLVSGKSAKLEITIFNAAGEKIITVPRVSTFKEYRDGDNVIVGWKLDNESGSKVAPGIYLAYCELIFSDGTPTVAAKQKVAVIK